MTDHTRNEKLLPCPLCGVNDAHLVTGSAGDHYVRCDQCLATTEDGPKERVIAIWNRHQPSEGVFDMLAHLQRQREWSEKTFGPGTRILGVIDHIRKELREIEADPSDITEWIDVVILALDGAWRAGYQPQQIIDALVTKQAKNEARDWPDWRTMPTDKAIEHDRSAEALSVKEPVAWRAPVNPCGQPGWEYAESERSLIQKGRHNREPLYASPPPKAVTITDEMVEGVFQAVVPFIAGTSYRELRTAITAALSSEAHNDHA